MNEQFFFSLYLYIMPLYHTSLISRKPMIQRYFTLYIVTLKELGLNRNGIDKYHKGTSI